MHHGFNIMLGKKAGQAGLILHVLLEENRFLGDCLAMSTLEIVQGHYLIPHLDQLSYHHTAYISGTAGNQDAQRRAVNKSRMGEISRAIDLKLKPSPPAIKAIYIKTQVSFKSTCLVPIL